MERETHGLDDSKPDVPAFEPPPILDHPHYPFVFIDQMLGLERPSLVTLWSLRSELRSALVARWCNMAKTHYWARNQCDELRDYLISKRQELPEPLRSVTQWPRPSGRSRPEMTATYFLLNEIARILIDDGYSDSEANRAVGLAIARNPSEESTVEAAIKKVRRARKRFRTMMPNAETE